MYLQQVESQTVRDVSLGTGRLSWNKAIALGRAARSLGGGQNLGGCRRTTILRVMGDG